MEPKDQPAWHRVEALLDAVLDLPTEQRSAYLDAVCADDPALRQEVESLLALETQAQARLGESLDDFAGTFVDHLQTEQEEQDAAQVVGQAVGPFRIARLLGRGGMGSVYLAERADGAFSQQVALKIVRRGLDTDDILTRFRYERQILASLDHPHIARLLDGGVTPDGRPYFAMEYVDGVPITTFADSQRLTTQQRLVLFRTVCRAVQYAHQNLVIHRDLKPSNILVTADGTVKLLDFGIAKLLDEEAEFARVPKTRTGLNLMTPEYAAPEQIMGKAVSVATDVYQLGGVLYELLTGHRPYNLPSRIRREVERIILEEEPTRPSTVVGIQRVTVPAATTASVSDMRQTSLDKLRRELRGDLDRIVLKALGKAPSERYPTVDQLSADVQRYLSGHPIVARRPTLRYRARKFVRRHQAGVMATAAVMLVALVFGIYHTNRITAERNLAQQEAATAQAVTDFMVDLFASNDPFAANGDTLNAIDLLERGAARATADLEEQPEVQARILYTFGKVFGNMGQYQRAQPYLADALAATRRVHPAPHPDLIDPLASMGLVNHYLGRLDEAEQYLQEMWAMHIGVHGYTHPKTAQRLEHLAFHYLGAGAYAAAESLYTQIGALAERYEVDVLQRLALGGQGYVALLQGDYETALTLYKASLDAAYVAFDEPSTELFLALADYGMALGESGNYAAAIEQLKAAQQMSENLFAEESHQRLTVTMNLANMHLQQRAFAEADTLYRAVLEMQQRMLPGSNPATAKTQINLALSLVRQERFAEARPLLEVGVKAYEAAYDPAHPLLPETRVLWAVVLSQTGAQARGEEVARQALVDLIDHYGETHYVVAIAHNGLGQILQHKGQLAEAERHYRQAIAIVEETFSATHPDLIEVYLALGSVLDAQRQSAAAETALRQALVLSVQAFSNDHPLTVRARTALGEIEQ